MRNSFVRAHRSGPRLVIGALALLAMAGMVFGQNSTLSGRLTTSKGGTVANADISLLNLPAAPMPNMPNMPNMPKANVAPVKTGTSAADGAFSLTQVPAGTYVLQIDAQGFERFSQEITVPSAQPLTISLEPLEVPGAEAAPAINQSIDPKILLDRIAALEKKVQELESTTVLSAPEIRTKREVKYIDKNSNIYDEPHPGAKKTVTYERERVLRRQNIDEKIEAALQDDKAKSVAVGVSAGMATQAAIQTMGEEQGFNGHKYALASADITFAARVAQNTTFFADLVGLTGPPADNEISGITLLNSFNSRLVLQNQLNVREAWLRTELFRNRLALTAGRVDLTNYFDRSAVANDEFTQFLSDALVNSPALGLPVNGIGFVGIYDPKNSWLVKAGYQQSALQIDSLSDAAFNLGEVDHLMRPFGLPEGNYRFWYRYASTHQAREVNRPAAHGSSVGTSIDQKLTDQLTLFGRYGYGNVDIGKLHFYSGGFQVQKRFVVNPGDQWALGYAQTVVPGFGRENLAEGYYNFRLSEKLRLSLHLTHVVEARPGKADIGYFVPGMRFIATF